MEEKTTRPKSKVERLTKINKDRKILMRLLAKLRKQINALLIDKGKNRSVLDTLFKRRKGYRRRLTKLTVKRRTIRCEPNTP